MRKTKLSDFFLKITIPVSLLPFRKAFYYWTKAANILLKDSTRVAEVYEILKKVNPDNLYTDNNRSFYFAFLAAVLYDLGDKQTAMKYLGMSSQLPHKKMLEGTIEKLREQFTE